MAWCLLFAVPAVANTIVTWMDAGRAGESLALWQPALWEGGSALVSILLLPPVLSLCARRPLHADTWRRRWPLYLGASLLWSLAHVAGMVLLRKLGYALLGQRYDFGDWPRQLAYEYLKDARTFAAIVVAAHAYRWFWRRLQGEARLLDATEHAPEPCPPARPERFLVRKLGREFLVAASDIEWLQAAGNYVNLRVRGHDYPLRSTIGGIGARLDPQRFARVHLRDGGMLPCSRTYRATLRQRVGADA